MTRNGTGRTVMNPPFDYVREQYSLNIARYVALSATLRERSEQSAAEFAQIVGKSPTDSLVHFFFDFYLMNEVVPRMGRLCAENDATSAIIDGIHFEQYGDQQLEQVESILHLWATKPTCFAQTILGMLRKPRELRLPLLASILMYCLGAENIAITEVRPVFARFMTVVRAAISELRPTLTEMLSDRD